MTANRTLYLAYGANTHRGQMKHRCPEAKYVGNATLLDHRLVFRGVADVVRSKGSKVECALWAITRLDEQNLDAFEGVSTGFYVKRYVDLKLNGKMKPALIYVMSGLRADEHEPPESYEVTLRQGYAACKLPAKQIDDAIRNAHRSGNRRPYRGRWRVGPAEPMPASYTSRWLSGPSTDTGAPLRTQAEIAFDKFLARSQGGKP
jgi:gamma-glutamylcyclotransferase (GGCT)/AIG2-like uncharacterized protein YtfP